jgi:hypothetical protein
MSKRRVLVIATLVAAAASHAALAQNSQLGRLFYTDRQRAALDANIRSIVKKPEKAVPIPPSVTLNGIVTRSDGERTVWIDGRAYHRDPPADLGITTRPADPGMAELEVKGVARRLPIRVGQRVDPASGKTFEPYETPPQAK